MLTAAWNRLWSGWQAFAGLGLGAVLLLAVMATMGLIAGFYVVGTRDLQLINASVSGVRMGAPLQSRVIWGERTLFAVVLAFVILGGVLVFGALVEGVVAHRRGQPTGFRNFWQNLCRHFPDGLTLSVLTALPLLGLFAAFYYMSFSHGLDNVAYFLRPFFLLAAALLFISLGLYPRYMMSEVGEGVLAAFRQGWRLIVTDWREALRSAIVSVIMLVAQIPLLMLAIIPYLGWLLVVGELALALPFTAVYFVERFEQRVRPPEGEGDADQEPGYAPAHFREG